MPVHARTQIRAALKALLMGLTTTGNRVEIGRTFALPANHQPTLLIYAKDEKSSSSQMGGSMGSLPKYGRLLQVVVQGRVTADAPPDDLLDVIAKEVETKIGANQKLGGLIVGMELTDTKQETIANEHHQGLIQMEFSILYRTAEGAPTVSV